MQTPQSIKAYVALAAVCLFWGTTYLAIRVGIESMPPFLFAGVRFLIAGALICGFFIIKNTNWPGLREWKQVIIVSILFFVIGNTSVVQAEKHISSGLAALICSAIPIWVVLFNMIKDKSEKINFWVISGLVVGFAGLMMIFYDNIGDLSNPGYLFSIIFLLFGNLTWSYGTVYSKNIKWTTPLLFAGGLQMLISGIILTVIGMLKGEMPEFKPDTNGWIALLYLAGIGSVLTYGAYLFALSKLPSTVVSLYAYVNPVVAVILGWLILGEQFGIFTLVAMVITLAGVYMVNAGFNRKKAKGNVEAEEKHVETAKAFSIRH
jgi:drug/metabolite transporter (DMT)-like permease